MNLQGHPRPGPEAAALKEAVDDEVPDLLLPSPASHPLLHPHAPLPGATENYPEMQPSSPRRVSDLGPQLFVSSSCLTPGTDLPPTTRDQQFKVPGPLQSQWVQKAGLTAEYAGTHLCIPMMLLETDCEARKGASTPQVAQSPSSTHLPSHSAPPAP